MIDIIIYESCISRSNGLSNGHAVGGGHRNGHASGSSLSISSNNNVGWKLSQMFADLPDDAPINKMLPKELLLRIFSFLDVVSLCRCAQVDIS